MRSGVTPVSRHDARTVHCAAALRHLLMLACRRALCEVPPHEAGPAVGVRERLAMAGRSRKGVAEERRQQVVQVGGGTQQERARRSCRREHQSPARDYAQLHVCLVALGQDAELESMIT